jgi:hypothetical protein
LFFLGRFSFTPAAGFYFFPWAPPSPKKGPPKFSRRPGFFVHTRPTQKKGKKKKKEKKEKKEKGKKEKKK